MAKIKIALDKKEGKGKNSEKTIEELEAKSKELLKEFDELLELPNDEFLSDEVTKRLDVIRNELLKISLETLNV